MFVRRAAVAMLTYLLAGAAGAETALIPRSLIFGPPERSRVQISPDGRHLAWLEPVPDGVGLRIRSLDSGLEAARGSAVSRLLWSADGARLLYLEQGHLHALVPGAKESRNLTPFDGVTARNPVVARRRPGEVLIELNKRDRRMFDVHRVDLESGAVALDTENPGSVIGWVADLDLRVRAAVAGDARDGSKHLLSRASAAGEWRRIAVWPYEEQGGVVGFEGDGASLVVETSLGADTSRLFRVEAATGKERGLVAHDPRADVGRVMADPADGAIQAISFELLEPEWTLLDPQLAPDFAALAALQRGAFWVTSRDRADATWLVAFQRDGGPAHYALWHRAEKRVEDLFGRRPALEPYTLARRQGRMIPTRDGARLTAWLTLPPAAKAQALPLVLAVHGGPWSRDRAGWDPLAQWLANRGYAVLQVNFRGSAGFGRRFLEAGYGQWGRGLMQRDLEDAVDWAVKQGLADPKRVALYGVSYGGYAVVSGLAFTPRRYACGVALAAPLDLASLVGSVPREWAPLRARLLQRIGDVEGDAELNRSLSPVFHAGAIRAPLMLARGADDARIRDEQVERIADSLRKRQIHLELVTYEGEGPRLERMQNRMDFYARAEAFLTRHLGGRAQP
jgi:dipeptidyl aminopeptidase/acylaminoacyl peptidase